VCIFTLAYPTDLLFGGGFEHFVEVSLPKYCMYLSSLLASNRTYFAAINLFRCRLLSRATRIILYKTLIRPIVLCGAEAWTLTKTLLIFERKIFKRIYGPKYENREWKSQTNRELEEMSK